MFNLKALSKEAIPHALERVERYRLLHEPALAASICHDILRADPDNRQALIALLLSLTDQFSHGLGGHVQEARAVLPRLHDEYERAYYAGIISERRARAQLVQSAPGCRPVAYEGFREAMDWYEKAEKIRPPGNDDAILRWNTCARTIVNHHLEAGVPDAFELPLE